MITEKLFDNPSTSYVEDTEDSNISIELYSSSAILLDNTLTPHIISWVILILLQKNYIEEVDMMTHVLLKLISRKKMVAGSLENNINHIKIANM